MLWRRSPHPLPIPPSTPVPDAEALRRAALQASWRRDRWVARRRVWARWLLWASVRYLMPAMLVAGLGAWLWLGVLPHVRHWLERPALINAPPEAAPPASPTGPPTPPAPPAPRQTDPLAVDPDAGFPEGLQLHLETRWAASTAQVVQPAPSAASADASPTLIPHLKPENWLHSKEP